MNQVPVHRYQRIGRLARILCLMGACLLVCRNASAQAAAEAAGLTSVSATTTTAAKTGFPSVPKTATPAKSAHLPASPALPSADENRRTLEQHAGPNAAKVLFRTQPSDAQVWINGALVGNAPLLVFVAPGKYQVEFRGPRQEYGKSTVDVLPKETRELSVELTARYPIRVSTPAH